MRRIGWLLGLLLLALTACGRAEGEAEQGEVVTGDTSPYQLIISSSDMTPQASRLVLTLWDGPERLAGAQALDVSLFTLGPNGEAADKIWEGPAKGYQMAEVPYWVAFPAFPAAGTYGVRAVVTTSEGAKVENLAVVTVKEKGDAPALGEPAPRSDTLTLADVNSVEELTSAGPYIDRFYEMSVAEAADSGKVSIIAFATPGHCTSALCSPVLDTLATVSEGLGEEVNVVHVEIWRNFEREELDPAVQEWNLPSEPWLFVLNPDGTIGARLDGPVSPDELREAVSEVEGG